MVRNLTSLTRLRDVLPALAFDDFVAVKFVVDEGSAFARDVGQHLAALGTEELSWEEAASTRFDAILAAHVNQNLAQLDGPLVVIPHGAGYNRLVPASTADTTSPAGLSRHELLWEGELIPSVVGLSHQEQLDRLRETCPEAVDRAVVVGDPVFDQMTASQCRANHYRQAIGLAPGQHLVVVNSTWNSHSVLASQRELLFRLLAELPTDEFRVALVLHANIWFGHSKFEVLHTLRDAVDSGLIIVPPESSWQAFLLAADVIVGDHGSVSFYGAALGRPFLLAADGRPELDPDSPTAKLCEAADRLDVDGDLRGQLVSAMLRHDPGRLTAITDRTLGHRGASWTTLRSVMFDLMGLPEPARGPRMTPVPDPAPQPAARVTSHLMCATVHDDVGGAARIEVERFPAVVADPERTREAFLTVDAHEVEEQLRMSGELLVNNEVQADRQAAAWMENTFRRYPGACLVAAATESGCALRFRNGTWLVTSGAPPLLAAAAMYRWCVDDRPVTADLKVWVRMGAAESMMTVWPVTALAEPI